MEKSFRGQKHVCSNCNTKFFDFNKEKIICPNCKTEIVMKKTKSIVSDDFEIKKDDEKIVDDIDLSEEVEFDDNEFKELNEDDTGLIKE